MKKKTKIRAALLVMIACAMLMCAVSSTMAWLQDQTDPVTNTFTPSHIDVDLAEAGATDNLRTYDMVPGYILDKNPIVTVKADSEKCYVFLQVTESENLDDYILYNLEKGEGKWLTDDELPENVLYRVVEKSAEPQTFTVIAGGTYTFTQNGVEIPFSWQPGNVLVNPEVTEEMMEALSTNKPTLKFEAFAVQMQKSNVGENQNFTPAEAWALIAQ